MATNFYGATSLTGGGTGALDAIDGTNLADLDAAFVVTLAYVYFYSLDDDSAAAESSPDVISPDANAGNKRWILTGINELTATEVKQLENIDSTTISAAQWGYLGAATQGIWTTTHKARAYVGTNQTIATATVTKLNLDTESYDPGADFDSTTDYDYTVPVTGYYLISAGVGYNNLTAVATRIQVAIYNGATSISVAEGYGAVGSYNGVFICDVQSLTLNDVITLRTYHNSGSNETVIADPAKSFLSIHFISEA